MGRVFLGVSPGGRRVAVKVVHARFARDPGFRRRFAREVEAARQVGGFHTALVVAADSDADQPWMATMYIPGPSLREAIAHDGPMDDAGVRGLGAALAEGLATIHACGLIHRDLKPDNIILGADGPVILDFGIAKVPDVTTLTGPEAIVGTIPYMSPEQLSDEELTPRSDVFALGGVLVYAATGHEPFPATSVPAVVTRILRGPPDLAPLAGPLLGIVSRCLAKDPGSRPTPDELLARFGPALIPPEAPASDPDQEPPREEPPRADPAMATGGTQHPSPDQEPTATTPPRVPSAGGHPSTGQDRPPENRRRVPLSVLAAAGTVVTAGLIAGAVLLADGPLRTPSQSGTRTSSPPASTSSSLRPTPTSAPRSASPSPTSPALGSLTATLRSPDGEDVEAVAFSPDGTLAAGVADGPTYLWNTAGRKVASTIAGLGSQGVYALAFSPDGATLATTEANGNGYLWDVAARHSTATLVDTHSNGILSLAFSPNGAILATTDNDGYIYLWNTSTGQESNILTDPGNSGNPNDGGAAVAFAPDGTLAASDGVGNGKVYLWNTATGQTTGSYTDPDDATVTADAFSPKGTTFAVGDITGKVYLWSTAARKVTATLTDPSSAGVDAVAFAPNGNTLATLDRDGNVYLWNNAGDLLATLSDPSGQGADSIAFSPNGTTLATGDADGSTYLWAVASGA